MKKIEIEEIAELEFEKLTINASIAGITKVDKSNNRKVFLIFKLDYPKYPHLTAKYLNIMSLFYEYSNGISQHVNFFHNLCWNSKFE